MAITNNYLGFSIASNEELNNADNDTQFGENLNRSIAKLNQNYNYAAGITNTYTNGFINQFGASSNFSTNEQRMIQNMVRESITANGITVRYMPRFGNYEDNVWNEQPEATFHRGLQMDMLLVAAAGFEGEGDVMTQYGIEFREEVILSVAIPRFDVLYNQFDSELRAEGKAAEADQYKRTRPLEGDLIVIPFGRSSQNKNTYVPKVFEILRVTTYHDGAFFQVGDNYQYKIRARLFELSAEDLNFNPTVVRYNTSTGAQTTYVDSDTGPISRAKDPAQFLDSELKTINVADSEQDQFDSWADNAAIEKRSVVQDVGEERVPVIVDDYTARSHKQTGIINIDEI